MIDIIQWRSAIGSHNASCCHFKGVGDISFNSKADSIEFAINTSLLIYLCITFTCAGTCAVYDVISMLLLLSGDIETNPGPVTGQKIELGIVFNFLKPHSALWDDIGRELKVDFNFRESLHKDGSINDNKRLEKVLHQWIESKCSDVSWNHLIELLQRKLDMASTAEMIHSSLSADLLEGPPATKHKKLDVPSHLSSTPSLHSITKPQQPSIEHTPSIMRMEGASARPYTQPAFHDPPQTHHHSPYTPRMEGACPQQHFHNSPQTHHTPLNTMRMEQEYTNCLQHAPQGPQHMRIDNQPFVHMPPQIQYTSDTMRRRDWDQYLHGQPASFQHPSLYAPIQHSYPDTMRMDYQNTSSRQQLQYIQLPPYPSGWGMGIPHHFPQSSPMGVLNESSSTVEQARLKIDEPSYKNSHVVTTSGQISAAVHSNDIIHTVDEDAMDDQQWSINNSDAIVNSQSPTQPPSSSLTYSGLEPSAHHASLINTSISSNSHEDHHATTHNTVIPEHVRQCIGKIQGRYTVSRFPSYLKYPSPSISEFINLLVVNKEKMSKKQRTTVMKYKREGNASLIKKKFKESIALGEIAVGCEEKRCLVLIEGDPGVGKTTLAWELCKGWAEGRLLQEWTVVLLVQLRDNLIRKATTEQSLVDPFNKYIGLYEYIQSVNGKGLLLIFDGFDELSDSQRRQSSLFMKILNAVSLSFASIIVTSRPSATELLPEFFLNNLYQHIEVIGFEEKDIKHYIRCKFDKNTKIRKAFTEYSESHPFIFTLMYVPLHCALVTDLYETYWKEEEEKFIPRTITQLYTIFIRCLFKRNKQLVVKNIEDLPPTQYEHFLELAKLAAKGIKERQYVFDGFNGETFGLLQSVTSLEDYVVKTVSYSFLHLTLQEYLAAYYWSTRHPDDPEVQCLFKKGGALPVEDYFNGKVGVSLNWPVLQFYSGLTGIIGTPLKEIVIRHKTNEKNFLNLLFESQNPDLVSNVFSDDVHPYIEIKSVIEAYVIGYCIARSSGSVKWQLKMRSSFTASLVNGIVQSAIPGKGGVIQELHVTGDAFNFFRCIDNDCISSFVNKLNIMFEMSSFSNSLELKHGFNLTEFYCDSSRNVESIKLVASLLNVLSYFDSLQIIIINWSNIGYYSTITSVDDNGVNLQLKSHKCCLKRCIQSLLRNQFPTTNHLPSAVLVDQRHYGELSIVLSNHESFRQQLMSTGLIASESPSSIDLPVIISLFDDLLLQQYYLNKTCFFRHSDKCNWPNMSFSLSDSEEKKLFINILVNHENACFWTEKIQTLKNIQSLCVIGSGSECIEGIVQSVTDSIPGVTVKRNLKLALRICSIDRSYSLWMSPSRVLLNRCGYDVFTILVRDHSPIFTFNAIMEEYSSQIISLIINARYMDVASLDTINYKSIQYDILKELQILHLSSEQSAQLISDGLRSHSSSLEVVGLSFKIDESLLKILLNGLMNQKLMRVLSFTSYGDINKSSDTIEYLQAVLQTAPALTHVILDGVNLYNIQLVLTAIQRSQNSNIKEFSIRNITSILATDEFISAIKHLTEECPWVRLMLFPMDNENKRGRKEEVKRILEDAVESVGLSFSDNLQLVFPSDKEFKDYQRSFEMFTEL